MFFDLHIPNPQQRKDCLTAELSKKKTHNVKILSWINGSLNVCLLPSVYYTPANKVWGCILVKKKQHGGGGYNNEFLTNLQHKNIIALLKYVFPRKC